MAKYQDNSFLLTRTIILSVRYADWDGSYARAGVLGWIRELIRSLIGTNTWPFFFRDDQRWQKADVVELFRPYRIAMWGWGYSGGLYFFRVKKRQARWAEYLLRKNGAPLTGKILGGDPNPAQKDATAAKSQTAQFDASGQRKDAELPLSTSTPGFQPVQAINRMVDRIADL